MTEIPDPCGQLLGSVDPDSPGLKSQSGLMVCPGSGDSERSSKVSASEEHAEEHKSSEEKVRLPSLASELERLRREGTVRPANRMRASISCAR